MRAPSKLACVQLLAVTLVVFPASAQQQQPCPALSDYTTLHPNCQVSSSCLEVQCTNAGRVATLTVHNCEDPVQVDLQEVGDSSTWTHVFSVTGEESRCTLDMGADNTLFATYSRNTTHLQFEAYGIVEGDIVLSTIPHISIPLNLRTCTCNDLQEALDHFHFPVPSITYSCTVDTNTCTNFNCLIGYNGESLNSDNVIDPCPESVTITAGSFQQIFTDSHAVQTTVGSFPITVYVGITHYTYSMTLTVLMSLFGHNVTLLPEETIVLDRSSCPNVNRFPAAPLPDESTNGCASVTPTTRSTPATRRTTNPGSTATATTPGSTSATTGTTPGSNPTTMGTISGSTPATSSTSGVITNGLFTSGSLTNSSSEAKANGSLSLAVVVAVPVLVALVVCVAVVFSLIFFCLRKKREVRFRRVAFERMVDADEDMVTCE